jgi:lysophospholipase L1-like esterase
VTLTEDLHASGWQAKPRPDDAALAAGLDPAWVRTRVEGHRQQMRADSLARNRVALEGLAQRLRARGVKLAVLWVPVSPEYTARFGAADLAAARAIIAELQQRVGLAFFDYGNDPRIQPRDFFNADHLNAEGAAKWSDILAAEVVRPLLSTPPVQR